MQISTILHTVKKVLQPAKAVFPLTSKIAGLVALMKSTVIRALTSKKMFPHPNQVESCKQCFYDEEGDSGEKNCQIGSSVNSVTCPGKFSVGLLFFFPN